MRTFALIAVLGLAASCAHGSGRNGPEQPAGAGSPSIRVEYRKPANPAHEPLYADVRDRHVLEKLAEVLGVVRLPKPLTLAFAGCDGTSNAWYDGEDQTITFCYEYLAEMRHAAATYDLGNVPPQDAIDGPMVFVLLHESGHAVFDLLKVPVLGREEDAADSFAAVALLRMGKGVALRMLRGAAWAYAQDARTRKVDESDFADVHGLDSQRYYNVLCMAYGSDSEYFAAAVQRGKLPKERAEGCAFEYQQALFAVHTLIAPSIDAKAVEQVRARHRARWE
jgi:Putative metallopeptidase